MQLQMFGLTPSWCLTTWSVFIVINNFNNNQTLITVVASMFVDKITNNILVKTTDHSRS